MLNNIGNIITAEKTVSHEETVIFTTFSIKIIFQFSTAYMKKTRTLPSLELNSAEWFFYANYEEIFA